MNPSKKTIWAIICIVFMVVCVSGEEKVQLDEKNGMC